MRLLEHNSTGQLSLTKDLINDIPKYAILSHTWGAEEVTFRDLIDGTGKSKAGYDKIRFCAKQAANDGLQFFWVDTCCIDKSSSAELQEAIYSMFAWYKNAAKCYVYLSDVSARKRKASDLFTEYTWESAFRSSRWFTRGWTLQELLAPGLYSVVFFSQEGDRLGNKRTLERQINEITGIPVRALRGTPLSQFDVDARFLWAKNRQTTHEEDNAYSLFGIFDIQMPLLYGEGRDKALRRLRDEIDKPLKGLDRLPTAIDAPFNSYNKQHEPTCLPDTRVDLLQEIYSWANGQDKRCIFWLNGSAGTGKSTIARTVAHKYKKQSRLGASFFFSRGGGDVSHAGKFVASIAVQLASSVPTLQRYICDAISKDTNIASKGLRDQWNQLIFRPLFQLNGRSVQSSFIIVIDALDECEVENDVRLILQLLAEANNLGNTRLLIFLTSRPETPVRLGFRAMRGIVHHDLVLHDVPRAAMDHDIEIFIRDKFRKMREEFEDLPANWPRNDKIEHLIERADGLFIFAATVCRFIKGDGQCFPQDLLDLVIPDAGSGQLPKWERDVPSQALTWELDEMYTQVLQRSIDKIQGGQDRDRLLQTFKLVIGSLTILAEPLPAATLANLVQIRPEAVNLRIQHLHSVLNVPQNPDHPIRLLHPSFRDFLLDEQRCRDQSFRVDEKQAHRALADNCIRLMSNSLKQNVCGQEAPGTLVSDVKSSQIEQFLPREVRYACLYWIQHLQKSDAQLYDNDQVHQFLQVHLLHWLEALGWMGKTSEGILAILLLEAQIAADKNPNLYAFVHDTKQFVLYNRSVIEQAPMQLYSSALVFAPEMSFVRRLFEECIPPWIQRKPKVQANWNTALQTLKGHTACVRSVAFSTDGKQVVSGSDDKIVRLWDAVTGAVLQTLEGHTAYVRSVAFSTNNKQVVSGSDDKTVRLWDTVTGAVLQTLESHIYGVNSVAFSPDGKQVVSGSDDKTVRLWDAVTGAVLQTLEGHTAYVRSVAFSADGKQVISGSWDTTVRLWDAVTGTTLQVLEGHTRFVNSVAFSADGSQVVSGSSDKTVQLWDAATGAALQTLKGHTDYVDSVAISADGKQVVSGSWDKTIRLWDAVTGAALQTFKGHTAFVDSVAFSADSKQVISGSWDTTVRLWDATIKAALQTLEGHTACIRSVAFSADGKQVVSGSDDKTIRLWDAVTGAALQTLEGHTDSVNSVAFSPDGKLLASVSQDRTVKLWDASSGAVLQTLECYSGLITLVAFSHDSKLLASASDDHTVEVWDTATGSLRQTAAVTSYVTRLAFDSIDSTLFTNVDSIKVDRTALLTSSEHPHQEEGAEVNRQGLGMSGYWVAWNTENLLWLPPDYWAVESDTSPSGSIVAGGCSSGKVFIIGFSLDDLLHFAQAARAPIKPPPTSDPGFHEGLLSDMDDEMSVNSLEFEEDCENEGVSGIFASHDVNRIMNSGRYFEELDMLEATVYKQSVVDFYNPSNSYSPWPADRGLFVSQIPLPRYEVTICRSSAHSPLILSRCNDIWRQGSQLLALQIWHLLECHNVAFKVFFNAISLQEAGFCNEFISLLTLDPHRTTCVRLLPVNIAEIQQLAKLFENVLLCISETTPLETAQVVELTVELTSYCQRLLRALGLLHLAYAEDETCPSDQSSRMLWRSIVHTLDLAILSYAGAHIEPFDLRYLGMSVEAFSVPAPFVAELHRDVRGAGMISLRRRSLECLDEFLHGKNAWVFCNSLSDVGSNGRLHLVTKIDIFADIWGPLWKECLVGTPAEAYRYRVGDGHIIPWMTNDQPTLLSGEIRCHWVTASDLPQTYSREAQWSFDGSETLVIGAPHVKINGDCRCDLQEIKRRLQQCERLRRLGTYDPSTYLDAQTLEIQVGVPAKGVVGKYARTWKRREGHPLRLALLEAWDHPELNLIDPAFFEHRMGLEVSLSTHNARKVPLVKLLGSSSMCKLLELFQWADDECRTRYMVAVRDADPKALRRLWENHPQWREDIRKAVCCCLQALSETGIGRKEDPEALCVAWVPAPGQRYLAMLTESRHSWAGSLKDSRDYFTMAVVSEQCLDFSPDGGRCCGRQGYSVFETALVINDSIKPRELKKRLITCGEVRELRWSVSGLKEGENLSLGDRGALEVIKPVGHGCILIKWKTAKLKQALARFEENLLKRQHERHCEFIEDDDEIGINDDGVGGTELTLRVKPLCVFLTSEYVREL